LPSEKHVAMLARSLEERFGGDPRVVVRRGSRLEIAIARDGLELLFVVPTTRERDWFYKAKEWVLLVRIDGEVVHRTWCDAYTVSEDSDVLNEDPSFRELVLSTMLERILTNEIRLRMEQSPYGRTTTLRFRRRGAWFKVVGPSLRGEKSSARRPRARRRRTI
jgi:hypothetical protein